MSCKGMLYPCLSMVVPDVLLKAVVGELMMLVRPSYFNLFESCQTD